MPKELQGTALVSVPTLGRFVHYRLNDYDVGRINEERSLNPGKRGNPPKPGQVFPMLIVNAWVDDPKPDQCIQGQVFLDGNDTLWVTSVVQGDVDGTYFWPRIKIAQAVVDGEKHSVDIEGEANGKRLPDVDEAGPFVVGYSDAKETETDNDHLLHDV